MLTITPAAAEAIESVLEAEGILGEDAGIRITHEPAEEHFTLALRLAAAPEVDDRVLVEEGARVFLPPETAALLGDKVLDGHVDGTAVGFRILDQQ